MSNALTLYAMGVASVLLPLALGLLMFWLDTEVDDEAGT